MAGSSSEVAISSGAGPREEAVPLGPTETDPDGEAPPPEDLPGIPAPGEEPSTDG